MRSIVALPDGEQKSEEAKRMIDRVRTFIGYREYPKYGMAPTGAMVGLPVSAGVIEGRARVILDMAQADLEAGDILVTGSPVSRRLVRPSGRVYDLLTAVVSSPLPRPCRQTPPGVTGTGR